jgi:hypothetical protein
MGIGYQTDSFLLHVLGDFEFGRGFSLAHHAGFTKASSHTSFLLREELYARDVGNRLRILLDMRNGLKHFSIDALMSRLIIMIAMDWVAAGKQCLILVGGFLVHDRVARGIVVARRIGHSSGVTPAGHVAHVVSAGQLAAELFDGAVLGVGEERVRKEVAG